MPNFTNVNPAIERYAVAALEAVVNIEAQLKDISQRADDISDRLFTACSLAQGELELFEPYDLADELKDRCKSLADDLLEIEIAAHDLDVVVHLINKIIS